MSIPASPRAKQTAAVILLLFVATLAASPLVAQSKPATSSGSATGATGVSADEGIRGKKLVLKDGTFQIVREYQVIGDRVRYYSLERSEWEEIPSSMVDWPATRKAEAQPTGRAEKAIALAHRVDLEAHPGNLDVDAGTGLPPGVLLPPGDGMFVFNGKSVSPIETHLAKSKLNKGNFIAKVLVPVPVVATKYTISLDGKRAPMQIPIAEPLFFYRINNGVEPQLRLIHTKEKGGHREIEFQSSFFGEKKTEANEVPLDIQAVTPDTYRIMAKQDLAPGEYVIAVIDPGQGIDLYVWDFGIEKTAGKQTSKK
ncbi:MAG: hypothetical protein KGL59_04650 [Acidobacteriota bacterium]|nr:hypothetical protein [Acidobacteriota bacterium]